MKKSYIIFLFIVFTILSFEILYFSRVIKSNTRISAQNTQNFVSKQQGRENTKIKNETKTVSNSEVKISPSAKIEMIQYYEKCGHIVTEDHKVPSAIVNMSEKEVEKYYSGWKIQFFSKDYLRLYREKKCTCPEHFVLKDMDGFISIYNNDENENEVLYRATDIMTKYLSEEDRENLKVGVYVTGKSELETLLQDFE